MKEQKNKLIGIIIITHYNFGKELFSVVEEIIGVQEKVEVISLFCNDNLDTAREKLKKAKEKVCGQKGALVFVDMFGGTPCNACFPFIQEDKLEIISGVNLPMLLKTFSLRSNMELSLLVKEICRKGKESIIDTKNVFLERLNKK
ncbi:hypothetical protein KAI68_02055 [bacterium]|nr:hypothetical protein [bacterium]